MPLGKVEGIGFIFGRNRCWCLHWSGVHDISSLLMIWREIVFDLKKKKRLGEREI